MILGQLAILGTKLVQHSGITMKTISEMQSMQLQKFDYHNLKKTE